MERAASSSLPALLPDGRSQATFSSSWPPRRTSLRPRTDAFPTSDAEASPPISRNASQPAGAPHHPAHEAFLRAAARPISMLTPEHRSACHARFVGSLVQLGAG
jgi:hypothetical protein